MKKGGRDPLLFSLSSPPIAGAPTFDRRRRGLTWAAWSTPTLGGMAYSQRVRVGRPDLVLRVDMPENRPDEVLASPVACHTTSDYSIEAVDNGLVEDDIPLEATLTLDARQTHRVDNLVLRHKLTLGPRYRWELAFPP